MGKPLFHIVKTNEYKLSGIANPDAKTGSYGYEWGSMHRPVQSMSVNDCAIKSGEVVLPKDYAGETYNAEFLQFDLSIVNLGDDWTLPTPEANPEMFITWPCYNEQKRKQLKDFVIITFTDSNGSIVQQTSYPGLFHADTFNKDGVYFVSNRFPFTGQRVQMNYIPDGTYKIEIKVNPVYGESEPAVVTVKFTGHDIAIVSDDTFPAGLVWKRLAA